MTHRSPDRKRARGSVTGRAVLLLALGLIAAACSSDSASSPATSPPSATNSPEVTTTVTNTAPDTIVTTSASTVPVVPVLEGASLDAVQVPESGCCPPGPNLLLNVTTQHQAGVDTVEFTFTGPVENYHVRYITPPLTNAASGEAIDLLGDNVLEISTPGSGTDNLSSPPRQMYTGPTRIGIVTTGGSVVELVQNGDFEGVLNWGVGVSGKPIFRVSSACLASTNTCSLIIEIASP